MESMDRDQAFAFLGLSEDATPDDIETQVDARRRQLELRLQAAVSPDQQKLLERALTDLEDIRALAMRDPRDPAAGLPGGAGITVRSGTLLADRYVVKNRIGVGERGAVFRALDLTWGRDVAIKMLRREALLVPGTVERLAGILRRNLGFAHAGLCNTYSLGRADGFTFIAMELVEGETLRQYFDRLRIEGETGLSAPAIARVMRPVCTALHYASERTPHLNLKPENILITADETIKITDFAIDDVVPVIPRGRNRAMTDQRRFRAPEQIRQSRNVMLEPDSVDGRADQYAIGALVYFLATGEAPLADAADLALRRPDLPDSMTAAVRRALSAAPENRYDSISDLSAELFTTPSRILRRSLAVGCLVALIGVLCSVAVWRFSPQLREWVGLERFLSESGAERQQALALRQRAEDLKGRLNAAERALRIHLRDAQLAAQRQEAGDGSAADAPAMTRAIAHRDMLTALSDLAVPQVFNSPEVLNAYNLLGLATQHVEAARYHEAVGVLSTAEAVLAARLADLREAERLVRGRYGLEPNSPLEAVFSEPESMDQLRAAWEAGVSDRRRFMAALDQGMVLIPGGSFAMGDLTGNGSRAEQPAHKVTVAPFKLGRTPVTRADYALCVEAGTCRADAMMVTAAGWKPEPNMPMTGVSWLDAQDYAAWLRTRTGEDYRLPSEAEWEYAARAGVETDYPWGNKLGNNRANCASCGSAWDHMGPAPVGTFAANAFGLYDVVGNVWQWTADCWYRDYSTAPGDGTPRDELACPKRVLRGGSWDNDGWMARISYRGGAAATLRQDINGFRIAKSVD